MNFNGAPLRRSVYHLALLATKTFANLCVLVAKKKNFVNLCVLCAFVAQRNFGNLRALCAFVVQKNFVNLCALCAFVVQSPGGSKKLRELLCPLCLCGSKFSRFKTITHENSR